MFTVSKFRTYRLFNDACTLAKRCASFFYDAHRFSTFTTYLF